MVTADMASAQEAAAGGGVDERLARLRGLQWRMACDLVEHIDSTTLEIPDKPAITNLPPRTVIRWSCARRRARISRWRSGCR